ncbi:hypothetical protein B0H63DRAFT_463062 [Podospora didyma]|uniref:FAD-binding domain-containing protein n=1 Tax=Podospora didyma TaxID=330526 RepID=A0AAE0NWQ7_9PEZI|nr:hypothetical protein B0H63DRAFT_463062 [Podospora didyma]
MPSAVRPDTASGGLRVAIIGAGITGINLALGLQARNVSYTVYERAPGFREIGAGIGFSPNAERAMGSVNPEVLQAFRRVANPNGEDYFQWVDGHDTAELLFRLHVGKDGFQGCRRCDILEEWAKLIPPERVEFGKEIDCVTEDAKGLVIQFKDGTADTADVVIGCDGIRSRIRQLVLSNPKDKNAAQPHYSSKYCFRALVPMPAAVAAIGEYRSGTRFMYNGPKAHVITYPIGNNSVLNMLAVLSDNAPWPDQTKHTLSGSKSEATAAFEGWHPTVRKIVDLFPEQMDKWAIFDMAEHPASTYVRGRICVAGDAAHAAGPHLGAGGGMGIEDALVLSELLAKVDNLEEEAFRGSAGAALIEAALKVYNDVRYRRTQDVVQSTRAAVDLFQWQDRAIGSDGTKFGQQISRTFHHVWDYDVDDMVREALAKLDETVRKP